MFTFGASVDFTGPNTPADTEVVIADSKDACPVAICDLTTSPPTFLCFYDSASDLPDATSVKVLPPPRALPAALPCRPRPDYPGPAQVPRCAPTQG